MMQDDILDVPVVDAHHHLVRMDLGYPWLSPDSPFDRYHGDDRPLRVDYPADAYRAEMRQLPLVASVHVENGAADPLREARWLGEVIAEHAPIPAVHVARADLTEPGAATLLEDLASMPHVRGIRHILNWHPDPRVTHTSRPGILEEPLWRANFARLDTLGLSFDLQVFGDQLVSAVRLAKDHPATSIILDHAGMPLHRDPEYLAMWRQGMTELGRCENVTVKISAIGTTDHHWTTKSIAPIVEHTIQAFGPDRVMFASNFPVDRLYSSVGDLYRAFAALTAPYTRGERREMFAGTAARTYRLKSAGR